jgi:single-stranded-DNA-specific exonuclease
MDKAVERLRTAREQMEHVRLFGDYDVDGISGTAVLYRSLKRFGINQLSYAMPNRLVDGYGLSPEAVEDAACAGVSLLITVDNGIKAHEAAERAASSGVDLIVTDHHNIEGPLPRAAAVVNPKRNDPEGPCALASGSAVAFKLASALTEDIADLGLTALGIVADIVPLRRENRTLVARGLLELAEAPRPGLAALAKRTGIRLEELRAEQIAFQLGPRLNAAGRLGDGAAAIELLLTEDPGEALRLAEVLNRANEERRQIERDILAEAEEAVVDDVASGRRALVAAGRGWHPGVIGIVAAKLQHAYSRPVVLIAIDDAGVGRGSARSSPGVDLAVVLAACGDLLERFGGHRAAAGFTIREAHIPKFRERFELSVCSATPGGELIPPELDVDASVALSQIDGALVNALNRLEPFGHGNPAPVFCALGVEIPAHSVRELRGGHVRLAARQGPAIMTVIGFNMADRLAMGCPDRADIAFTPQFNTWRGETTIQLMLKDFRP